MQNYTTGPLIAVLSKINYPTIFICISIQGVTTSPIKYDVVQQASGPVGKLGQICGPLLVRVLNVYYVTTLSLYTLCMRRIYVTNLQYASHTTLAL